METRDSDITLSICCITYNHEAYIAQALEGFLMQQTNFKVEIIIGEDCSTDRTRQIIEEYVLKYPGKINLITSEFNVGANQNCKRVFEAIRGKYIAICDGDDYWTDPLKLQKQVDFLEKNQNYIMCCHYSKRIKENNEVYYMDINPKPLTYTFTDVVIGKKLELSTLTVVFRNTKEMSEMFVSDWFLKFNAPDKFIKLYATYTSGKNIYVFPEIMSCYRQHSGGVWSSLKPKVLKLKELHDLYLILKIFKFSWTQKIKLFYLYLNKYFLFEVKEHSLLHAFSTIKTIL